MDEKVEYVFQSQNGDVGEWLTLSVTCVKPSEETMAEWNEKITWRIVKRTITEEVIAGQRSDE